jgi:hypothetical protein
MPIGIRLVYRVKRDRHDFYVYTLLHLTTFETERAVFERTQIVVVCGFTIHVSTLFDALCHFCEHTLREDETSGKSTLTCAATPSLTVATDMATGPVRNCR